MIKNGLSRNLVGGLLVTCVGLAFLGGALRMRIGSAMDMGPGYFPMACAILVTGLGLSIAATGLSRKDGILPVEWRPLLSILGAVAAFGLLLEQVGLIPAVAAGSLVASTGDRSSRPLEALLLALGTAVAAWLIFRVGLGLQMPGLKLPAWLG